MSFHQTINTIPLFSINFRPIILSGKNYRIESNAVSIALIKSTIFLRFVTDELSGCSIRKSYISSTSTILFIF